MLDLNNVYYGDCLSLMDKIDDKSIDMILCDLPYGTTACKWDTPIPFDQIWAHYNRIIKDNRPIVLTATEPFASNLRMSNIKKYKYDWYWLKRPVNFLNAKHQPLRKVENIVVFNSTIYNPQGLIPCTKINKRSNVTETNRLHGMENISHYTNYPVNTIEIIGERGLHPTQKPVALFEYLIKTYTNEGDLVLDNCAGSGTTGVACINTGRKYILMEKDEKYYNLAKERIKQEKGKKQYIKEKDRWF